MDTTQFLLTIILTATTVLMVVVGLQLIFVLREVRKTVKKIGVFVDEIEQIESKKETSDHKKQTVNKKRLALHSILDKIKFLSPTLSSKSKRFFVKENR
ncbi:hypothetical protein HZA76_03165 [Candidatus Roizmanbacteria bacterium]|nr:hypothetical protein [Candidatus Roizmanbacteria bacterium]